MEAIIEFNVSTTPNTLYQRGRKFYLGGKGSTPELVTVKQAVRWFLDCRRYARAFTHKGGIDFLMSYT
jgi:hypothetical protein